MTNPNDNASDMTMSAPQAINSGYLADLIEINEQALDAIKSRIEELEVSDYLEGLNQREYRNLSWTLSKVEIVIAQSKQLHECLVAKEQAEHRAERMTKSNSQIGMNNA